MKIIKLLEKNPKHRLGYRKGIEELKNHAFFQSVDSNVIKSRKVISIIFFIFLIIKIIFNIIFFYKN
jgi:hypothetical protein